MYIIGTSGHIDHGKTLLIKQLTGIDCDRLPEEKAREMTIDLGFSSMDIEPLGTVSIIDVPGHERFIRNMVAGAWGIDLGLLVVAADDGWMPQTEDHFRVLQLLGVERLVIALNKIDLVDEETTDFVRSEIESKLEGSSHAGSDIVPVSSRTFQGIDNLREAIRHNLQKLEKRPAGEKPYLYVDRAFASKGHGTVVTGTLKNGRFRENETVTILPGNREVKIKRIETHYKHTAKGAPSQRTALNLAGVPVDEISRGHIIVKENFFTGTGDFLAKIKLLRDVKVKNNLGTEILAGTASLTGRIITIGDLSEGERELLVRMRLEKSWFVYPGELFVLTSPGGYRIIGGGAVILPEYSRDMKAAVLAQQSLSGNMSPRELLRFHVSVNRWVQKKKLHTAFRENKADIDRYIQSLAADSLVMVLDDYIVDASFYETKMKGILDSVRGETGLNSKEVADSIGVADSLCRALLAAKIDKGEIEERDGRYFRSGEGAKPLSPELKSLLDELKREGASGIELKKTADNRRRKALKGLISLGHAVSLDGNIVLHKDVYADLKKKILALLTRKEKVTVSEAREAVSLSRKYTIPLLNRIEDDGEIKRLGDYRVKV